MKTLFCALALLAVGITPLLASGAPPASFNAAELNKRGEMGSTPFLDAILEGNTSLVARMIDAGAQVNYMPTFTEDDLMGDNPYATPLIMACGGHAAPTAEMVQLLLKAGADPNLAMPISGQTPLMLAASASNPELVSLLLKAGAKPNQKDSVGVTALMLACEKQSVQSVEALLTAGADAKVLGENKRNLLYYVLCASAILDAPAVEGVPARVVLIKMLHGKGVGVNQADDDGETALMHLVNMSGGYSSESEVIEIARCLIKLGANRFMKNKKGESALSLAQRHRREKLSAYLRTMKH